MELHKGALVQKLGDAGPGPDREVVTALRHHHLVVLNLLVEENVPCQRVLGIKSLRDFFALSASYRVRRLVEMHRG